MKEEKSNVNEIGYVGSVPIQNIWFLMYYASDLGNSIGTNKVAVEKFPDKIPDFVAEILCQEVEHRIKTNLSSEFFIREEKFDFVRGQINLLDTECHQLLERGKILCKFEDSTINSPKNCYVRVALEVISKIINDKIVAKHCKLLANRMRNLGVVGRRPPDSEVLLESIGSHNARDRKMLHAAKLALNLLLPTESAGSMLLPLTDKNLMWFSNVYENGIAGFYKSKLPKKEWNVSPSHPISWHRDSESSRINEILPSMITDITLENTQESRRIVIDTKFHSILKPSRFRREIVESKNIYQIYSYLRSQEIESDHLGMNSTGILLYPSLGEMYNEFILVHNHIIRFVTIDLASNTNEISDQLMNILRANSYQAVI